MRYNAKRLGLNLKLAVTRLQLLQKKAENQSVLARKEIARLLEKGKIELARIKVEQIIRDDYYVECMELMEMYCSLLSTRFGLIEQVKECDAGIKEAVCTLIWAAPRMAGDVSELKEIQGYLGGRYGRDFLEDALSDQCESVNPRVKHKLGVHTPDVTLVDLYMSTIAEKYKVDWTPPERDVVPDVPTEADLLGGDGGNNNNNNNNSGGGGGGGGNALIDLFPVVPGSQPTPQMAPPMQPVAPQHQQQLRPQQGPGTTNTLNGPPPGYTAAGPTSMAYPPPAGGAPAAAYPAPQGSASSQSQSYPSAGSVGYGGYPSTHMPAGSAYPPEKPVQQQYPAPASGGGAAAYPAYPYGGASVASTGPAPATAAAYPPPLSAAAASASGGDVFGGDLVFPSVPTDTVKKPSAPSVGVESSNSVPDFDELTRRFNALKK